jgi:gliding motility-associated-like protein
VVADVGDNFYDSAVFLEAGSFNIGGAVEVEGVVQNSDDGLLHEGCPNGFFEFRRQNIATSPFPLTVNYNISPVSTATSVADYVPLPGNVTIPAGSNIIKVPVETILDGIDEPIESIILELDIPCFCYVDSAIINIADPLDFEFELPNVALCENSSGIAMPEIEGGVPPFEYQWSNNATAESIVLTADDPSDFSLTITDACGNVAENAAQILITDSPSAQLSGSATICEGETAFLEVQFTGLAPWQIEYNIDGNAPILVEGIMDNPYFLSATEEGTYTLTGLADLACDGEFSGSGEVIVNRIEADIQVTPVICYGDSNGSIEIEIVEGIPPFEYNWSNGTSGTNMIEGLASAWYELSIVDARNCTKVLEIEVPSPTPIEIPSVDCDDLLNGRLNIEASGGTPPFLYSVNDGPFETENIFQSLEPAETYDLVVEDANGCQASFPFIMPMTYTQAASLPSVIPVSVGQEVILQPELEIPAELIANVRWIPEGVLSCNDCLNPNFRATEDIELTLRIFDIFGCSSQITVQIVVDFKADIFVPTVFSPNGDDANDYFTIFTNPFQTNQINSLQIFDRWGALIFETKNIPANEPEQGWDGRFNGQMMNSGVYVYVAILGFPDGSEQRVMGYLTLLR